MRDANLALADINASGLQETAKLVGNRVKVTTHIVDVSRREQVFQYADETAGRHGGVDIIINNAGVAVGDFLETIPMEDLNGSWVSTSGALCTAPWPSCPI